MRSWLRRQAGDGPVAVHARVLDGEHLLLAVRGEAVPLVLVTSSGEVALPTDAGADAAGPLTTATVLLDPAGEVEVRVGGGRRTAPLACDLAPPSDGPGLDAPPTPDGRAVWDVVTDAGLVLRPRPLAPGVPVLAVRGREADVEVVLGAGDADEVEVRREGTVTATLPLVRGDGVRVLRLGGLAADGSASGVLHADGHPLTRSRQQVARPQRATELPPLAPGGGLELRWNPAGHLLLRPTAAVPEAGPA